MPFTTNELGYEDFTRSAHGGPESVVAAAGGGSRRQQRRSSMPTMVVKGPQSSRPQSPQKTFGELTKFQADDFFGGSDGIGATLAQDPFASHDAFAASFGGDDPWWDPCIPTSQSKESHDNGKTDVFKVSVNSSVEKFPRPSMTPLQRTRKEMEAPPLHGGPSEVERLGYEDQNMGSSIPGPPCAASTPSSRRPMRRGSLSRTSAGEGLAPVPTTGSRRRQGSVRNLSRQGDDESTTSSHDMKSQSSRSASSSQNLLSRHLDGEDEQSVSTAHTSISGNNGRREDEQSVSTAHASISGNNGRRKEELTMSAHSRVQRLRAEMSASSHHSRSSRDSHPPRPSGPGRHNLGSPSDRFFGKACGISDLQAKRAALGYENAETSTLEQRRPTRMSRRKSIDNGVEIGGQDASALRQSRGSSGTKQANESLEYGEGAPGSNNRVNRRRRSIGAENVVTEGNSLATPEMISESSHSHGRRAARRKSNDFMVEQPLSLRRMSERNALEYGDATPESHNKETSTSSGAGHARRRGSLKVAIRARRRGSVGGQSSDLGNNPSEPPPPPPDSEYSAPRRRASIGRPSTVHGVGSPDMIKHNFRPPRATTDHSRNLQRLPNQKDGTDEKTVITAATEDSSHSSEDLKMFKPKSFSELMQPLYDEPSTVPMPASPVRRRRNRRASIM